MFIAHTEFYMVLRCVADDVDDGSMTLSSYWWIRSKTHPQTSDKPRPHYMCRAFTYACVLNLRAWCWTKDKGASCIIIVISIIIVTYINKGRWVQQEVFNGRLSD